MIPILGQHTSPLKPKLYIIIFMTVDFFSLLLQGVGGGMAGAAFSKKQDTTKATNIIIAGILFQLASTCTFVTLFEYVMWRGWSTLKRNRPLLILALAVMVTSTTMVIRGIFRSMELMNGWRSLLATTERFHIVLEGVMMAIGIINFNIFHPERLLRDALTVKEQQSNDTRLTDIHTDERN